MKSCFELRALSISSRAREIHSQKTHTPVWVRVCLAASGGLYLYLFVGGLREDWNGGEFEYSLRWNGYDRVTDDLRNQIAEFLLSWTDYDWV